MNKFKNLLVVLGVMAMSPAVLAQSYSGHLVDLNNIYDPPANVQGDICDRQFNAGQANEYKACIKGVAGADTMAQKYAVSAGEYMGCVDGYYQGIWDGFSGSKDPTPQMIAQAKALFSSVEPTSAIDRALKKADIDSTTVAADQIIKLYRGVIGRVDNQGNQLMPNKSYQYPTIRFKGFTDGYTNDLSTGAVQGGDFSDVYSAKWVTSSDKFERRSAARKIYQLQQNNRDSVCDNSNTIFGRKKMVELSIWDYFRANRTYNFEKYGWANGSWAFDFFTSDAGSMQAWKDYNGISFFTKMVDKQELVRASVTKDEVRKVFNSDGTPKLNPDGSQITETFTVVVTPAVYRTIQVEEQISNSEANKLKGVFKTNFVTAYQRHYARKHASRSYHKAGMAAYNTAKITGQLVGESVAKSSADRGEYNNRYQALSLGKYSEKLKDNYEVSFDTMIDKFEKHSIVELNSASIEGDELDGIFRPGEGLKARLTVTNLGETLQEASLKLGHSGQIQGGIPFRFSPKVLSQTSHQSDIIGNISASAKIRPNLNSSEHTKLRASLSIFTDTNISDVQTVLNTTDSQTLTLNEIAEVRNVETGVNLLTGTLDINVVLENKSDFKNTALPQVVVKLDNFSETNDVEGNKLAGGEIRTVPVPLSSIDPLAIIKNGRVSGIATSKMNGKVLDQRKFSYEVGNYQVNLLNYYHALAVSNSGVNTGSQSKEERLNNINATVLNDTVNKIANRTNWKKGHIVANTMIGQLVDKFENAKRDGTMSEAGKQSYAKLAKKLAPLVAKKGRGLRVRKKRRYLKLLKRLDPNMSTKPRHYKKYR
jgi:hypothetical protein